MLLIAHPTTALAHDGGTLGIEIPVERIAPGDDLPVNGADWAARSPLEVWLQPAGQTRIRLGSVLTGEDGHFLAIVNIPSSVPAGPAAIEVISTYGVRDTALVTVDPSAPPPTVLAGTTSANTSGAAGDPFPLIALGGAIAALMFLGFKTRRRKAVD